MVAAAGFIHGRSETLGATTASTEGVTVTAAGSTNTKGSWASLGQTTFGWDWMNLCIAQTATADNVIDLGVSSDGSTWYVIAENLRLAGRKSADLVQSFALPLRIRSGAYVGVRVASSTASRTIQVLAVGSSTGMKGGNGYSRGIALYTPATSRGVALDGGGTAHTKSAWVQLQASTEASVDSVYVMIGQNADTTRTAIATGMLDIGVGASSSEYPLLENILMRWSTTLDGPQFNVGPLACYIPAGSRVVARFQSSDIVAGDRTIDVGVIGFVP